MAFYSYLFFSGNCREAFTRYQEIFGGELRLIAMSDAPPGEAPADPAAADLIMHASLTNGDDLLMASDDPTGDASGAVGFSVNFSTPDTARASSVSRDGANVELGPAMDSAPAGSPSGPMTAAATEVRPGWKELHTR